MGPTTWSGLPYTLLCQLLFGSNNKTKTTHSARFGLGKPDYQELEQACPLLSGSTYRGEPEASSKEQDKTPG